MNEIDFKNWLIKNSVNKKVLSDCISRLKKIERELNCDIDDEYKRDRCDLLLSQFSKMGELLVKKYPKCNFPIGKYSMNTYKLALKKYINFGKYIQCYST